MGPDDSAGAPDSETEVDSQGCRQDRLRDLSNTLSIINRLIDVCQGHDYIAAARRPV